LFINFQKIQRPYFLQNYQSNKHHETFTFQHQNQSIKLESNDVKTYRRYIITVGDWILKLQQNAKDTLEEKREQEGKRKIDELRKEDEHKCKEDSKLSLKSPAYYQLLHATYTQNYINEHNLNYNHPNHNQVYTNYDQHYLNYNQDTNSLYSPYNQNYYPNQPPYGYSNSYYDTNLGYFPTN